MERTYTGWGRVGPSFSDAHPTQKVCQDTPLWTSQQSKQTKADSHMQEPDRLPEIFAPF